MLALGSWVLHPNIVFGQSHANTNSAQQRERSERAARLAPDPEQHKQQSQDS